MQIISDAEGEAFIREAEFDIAVPVHVERFFDETKIFAYPSVLPLCEAYCARFADLPFDKAAVSFLAEGCEAFCRTLDYRADKHTAVVGANFLPSGAPQEMPLICKRIRREGKYENLTTFDLSALLAAERVIFAVAEGDAIVSAAVTCETLSQENAGGRIEISTETVPAFRGRGYATACVTALSAHLGERGYTALYKCRNENAASECVARHAGFVKAGDFAYFVFRKNR